MANGVIPRDENLDGFAERLAGVNRAGVRARPIAISISSKDRENANAICKQQGWPPVAPTKCRGWTKVTRHSLEIAAGWQAEKQRILAEHEAERKEWMERLEILATNFPGVAE